MAWTEVEHNGKRYSIDIQNFYTSVSTKETVAFEDLPAGKCLEYRDLTTCELARGFGYEKVANTPAV